MAPPSGSYIREDIARIVLRPVLRLCLRRSVKLREIVEIVKVLLVRVAREELGEENESVSRIAAMTGVHRKDVARILEGQVKQPSNNDLVSRVIGHWQMDRRFSSKKNEPLPLTIEAGEGTLAQLVRSVSSELNPYTVLFELERLGLVVREDDEVRLVVTEYAPQEDVRAGFELVATDMEDLLSAVDHNMRGEHTGHRNQAPHHHLTTRYDNICPEYLPHIREWIVKEGGKLHMKIRRFLSRFDKDLNPKLINKPGGGRVAVGSFSFTETCRATESDGAAGEDSAQGRR